MNHLLLLTLTGCRDVSQPPAAKPADPVIHVKESVGGNIGPIGGGRGWEYEGPASQAPEWAKPKPAKGQ
jgi:hypothetical protein